MAKRPFFCGNWKLYGTLAESVDLAAGVAAGVADVADADVVVAPGFVALARVAEKLRGGRVAVAAQNCYSKPAGAFTGEVSAVQIADAGGRYVIVGHSERRQYFGETDELVADKARAVCAADLVPIICVGETLAERDGGETLARVRAQTDTALEGLAPGDLSRCIIAYEPVWAIGTGRNATPAQAVEVHQLIRSRLSEHIGAAPAREVRIIYGGSVKPDNIAALMAEDEIDGALVGGASQTVSSFVTIVKEGTRACFGH
jgi:triosephosphate isomerase